VLVLVVRSLAVALADFAPVDFVVLDFPVFLVLVLHYHYLLVVLELHMDIGF
jgi:hypothetical protein